MNKFFILSSVLFILLAASCNTAKLSTAEAQYDRGEYFQAANTFRKVYNKTSSSKERTLKGQIAYKAATCYDRLNMAARASSSYQNAIRYNFKDSLVFLNLAQNLHK